MGASASHPPLIALNGGTFGENNTILVPADAFKGGKYKDKRDKRGKYKPRYRRERDPYGAGYFHRGRGRDALWDDTVSDSFEMGPRRGLWQRRRGRGTGNLDAMDMPVGVGVGTGNFPAMPVYYDPMDAKAMSAPNLHVPGGLPPPGPYALGQGVHPMVGMETGMMPGYGPPPGYPAGMGSPAPYGYAQPAGPPQQQQQRRRPHPPGIHEIPQGAYVAEPQRGDARPNREPLVSDKLNAAQPANKKVGPSGPGWLGGDPFLDACTCTTNCRCRKGARVLYRAQGEENPENNTWGEIRYIVKDDLGKDCGDHSKCRVHDGSDDEGGRGRRKNKKKQTAKSDVSGSSMRSMREEMAGLRNDLAHLRMGDGLRGSGPGMPPALMGHMGQMRPGGRINSPVAGMPPHGGFPGMMDSRDPRVGVDPRIDPRMTKWLSGGDPYGMGLPPHIPPHGMSKGKRGRMAGMGGDMESMGHMGFEDDMSSSANVELMSMMSPDDMMGMPPPMRNMAGRRPKPPRRLRPRPPGGPPRWPPGIDPLLAYGPPRRGGIDPLLAYGPPRRGSMDGAHQLLGGRHPRPPPPGYDLGGGSGSGHPFRARPRFLMDDDDEEDLDSMRASNGVGSSFDSTRAQPGTSLDGRLRGGEARGTRPYQARVDDGSSHEF